MSRVDDVSKFILGQPSSFSGSPDDCLVKVEIMKLNVLRDIDLSLAYLVDIFNKVKEQEEKPKEKKPVEKTCETCMYDPNNKTDEVCFCNTCFDYSEWEEKE